MGTIPWGNCIQANACWNIAHTFIFWDDAEDLMWITNVCTVSSSFHAMIINLYILILTIKSRPYPGNCLVSTAVKLSHLPSNRKKNPTVTQVTLDSNWKFQLNCWSELSAAAFCSWKLIHSKTVHSQPSHKALQQANKVIGSSSIWNETLHIKSTARSHSAQKS